MEESCVTFDKGGEVAALVSFCVDSERFKSNYQRNKFYRGLYGWKQKVKRGGKEYVYDRKGILDRTPHIKVDKSVYIVPVEVLEKVVDYLDSWKGKVDYKIFKVLLEEDSFKNFKTKEDRRESWTQIPIN
ncbi:MAG: hypothetical protein ACLFQ8_03360 [Candidatus Aenigmatarchaeota archaeon]